MFTMNPSGVVLVTTTPRIEFKPQVPTYFIEQFLNHMAKGHIRITDYQGNELKVYYDAQ